MVTVNRNARGGIDKPSTRGTQAAPRVTARYTPISGPNAGQRVSLMSNGTKSVVPALSSTGARGPAGSTPPMTTPTGPVSSDSVLNQRNQQDAMNSAANALVTSPSDGFQFTPLQQQYSQMMQNQQNQNLDMFGELRRGVDLMYDAQLARTNMQYSNLMNDLRADFQKQTDIATSQAAALNPYSQAQGAMTANNFQGAISNKYQEQAARLQEAATIAQNELAAGNAQAYIEITNSMKQSNQMFQKGMMEFMMNAQSEFTKNQQWEQSFNLQKKEYSEGAFMDFVNNFGQDPAFKAGLQQYQSTGVITEGMMPLIQRGMEAGLSPAETLSIAQYETIDQRKNRIAEEQFQQQMSLGWYNAETSRINALASAAGKGDKNIVENVASRLNSAAQGVRAGVSALNKVNNFTAGWGGLLGYLPGTDARALAGDLDTLKANLGFDELAEMRANSPTGGALGSISNQEIQYLQATVASLDPLQDPAVLRKNIEVVLEGYQRMADAAAKDFGTEPIDFYRPEKMTVSGNDAKFNQSNTSTPAVANYLDSIGI